MAGGGDRADRALRLVKFALILAVAAFAAGCFYADEPLISRRWADRGIEPGRYTHAPVDPVTQEEWAPPTWEGEIRYHRDRRYRADMENFPHQGVRMRSLGGNVYVAEVPDRDGEPIYSYGLLFVYAGGVIAYHIPACSDLSEAGREATGLDIDEEGACKIDDLETLEAAFSAYLREHEGSLRIDGIYRRVGE